MRKNLILKSCIILHKKRKNMPDFKNSKEVLQRIKNQQVNAESENIDYKECFKFDETREKLELTKDIVSFANTEGGYIIFGVTDRDCDWIGLDSRSTIENADDSYIVPFIKKYVDCVPNFQIGKYELDNDIFVLLTIDKKEDNPIVFTKDGEYYRTKANGTKELKHVFSKDDIYGRIKSSSCRVNDDKSFFSLRASNMSIITNLNKIAPPYKTYIDRKNDLEILLDSLNNDRIRCAQINGLGGIGKTSFVRNFCDRICSGEIKLNIQIKYVIWITGKLDTFSSTGYIAPLRESELSFSEMIETFTDVLSIDTFGKDENDLKNDILDKLLKYNSIIVMDNMETITNEDILKFTREIPLNCRIIFTTRTSMTDTYKRIDLVGFDKTQFFQYVSNCLDEYALSRKKELLSHINKYLNDLIELVHGSPILINLIVYKISNGGNVEAIVNTLRNMKKNNSYYDSVMKFCFKSTFDNLSILEKKILFVMSISDISGEEFSIADLRYILKVDDSDINNAMINLFTCSFCSQVNQNYTCQPLVKVFVNKQMKDIDLKGKENISNNYYEWSKTKTQISSYEISLFNRVKAFDFERKKAYLATRELRRKFDAEFNYVDIKEEIIKLINEIPNFAYLYFFKAELENKADDNVTEIRNDYESAIKLDQDNDYYIAEYAFYLSYIKKNDVAIDYFKRALSIRDFQNYHFGLAVALTRFYHNKNEIVSLSDEIIFHFKKAYYQQNDKNNLYKNGRTSDAHAKYLMELGKYDEALEVCNYGLLCSPNDDKLSALRGIIYKKIDPEHISERQLKNVKKGIFSEISDDAAKELIGIMSNINK